MPSCGHVRAIFQAPDPPVSYYQAGGTPSLARAGPRSLRITYGAAPFDGGDRITAFQVYTIILRRIKGWMLWLLT